MTTTPNTPTTPAALDWDPFPQPNTIPGGWDLSAFLTPSIFGASTHMGEEAVD